MNRELLICVASHAGLYGSASKSTSTLAQELHVSQQTISRLLIELEDTGLITRLVTARGMDLALTDAGRAQLREQYAALCSLFAPLDSLRGTVATGLGEGAYYVGVYAKRIAALVSFDPFPGTLNITVDAAEAQQLLAQLSAHRIASFQAQGRTFGAVTLYPALVNGVLAALLRPDRTGHDDSTLEIIAAHNLRTKLKLQDGDVIAVTVPAENFKK